MAYFKKDRLPARSAIGANGLALGAKVEIECLATVEIRVQNLVSSAGTDCGTMAYLIIWQSTSNRWRGDTYNFIGAPPNFAPNFLTNRMS